MDLDEFERLAKAAPSDRWEFGIETDGECRQPFAAPLGPYQDFRMGDDIGRDAAVERAFRARDYLAAAHPQAVLGLIERVRDAEAALAELREAARRVLEAEREPRNGPNHDPLAAALDALDEALLLKET